MDSIVIAGETVRLREPSVAIEELFPEEAISEFCKKMKENSVVQELAISRNR
jgi:hypothetical protein